MALSLLLLIFFIKITLIVPGCSGKIREQGFIDGLSLGMPFTLDLLYVNSLVFHYSTWITDRLNFIHDITFLAIEMNIT